MTRVVTLVDSALFGFHLDLATDRPEELARGIEDLGRAAEALAGPPEFRPDLPADLPRDVTIATLGSAAWVTSSTARSTSRRSGTGRTPRTSPPAGSWAAG